MRKRIISIILTLAIALSVICVGAVSVSAAANTATIKVGSKTYTASVGDYMRYTVSFRYSGGRVSTGQIELPVNLKALNSYSQSEIDKFTSEIAPATASTAMILRSDNDVIKGFSGYVMNFAHPTGYAFSTNKVVFSLIFSVEKAGAYELAAKVRHVDAYDGKTLVDKDCNITDTKFRYTESLESVNLDTPKLSVATAAGGMRISWDPVPRASLYRVYYKGSKGWTKLEDTKETSVLDTDVVGGTRYTYTVRCLSADGSRFVSDYDTAGKAAVYYPAPVLSLSNYEDGVYIKWNAVKPASKYRVYYRGRNGWTRLTDTAGTSFLDTDVSSGTTYTYTIRSMDASGNLLSSYYSDGFKITYITAPTVTLSNAADGVNIAWDKVKGAVKYRVYYRSSNGWNRMVDTTENSYLDKDVRSNSTYTYTVRCINSEGTEFTSDFRAGKSIRYIAAPKLELINSEDGVLIKWSAVSGASKYRVYYKGRNGWTKLTDTTGTSFLDTDVSSGTTYTYTIRCMDSNNDHISYFYTDGFKITFLRAPTVTLSNAADGVNISWDKVNGAEKYRVYYRSSSGWHRLADTAETSYLDKDVNSNYTYTYTVRCINNEGTEFTSDFRAGKSIKYYAAPKLELSNTKNGVSIKWNAVAGVSKYRVYYYGRNGWTRLTETSSTSFIDTDVKSGTNYTYTIRCLDSSGNFLSYFYTDGFKIRYIPTS